MEKDYEKRTVNIMGLTFIITAFVTNFLLSFFLQGSSLLDALSIASLYGIGGVIGWILIRGYMIRYLKESKRIVCPIDPNEKYFQFEGKANEN